MKYLKLAAFHAVFVPVAGVIGAVLYPFAAVVVFLFFRPVKHQKGCEFRPTEYFVRHADKDLIVCVCDWCGRTAFQHPGGEIPKSARCERPRFGLGDLAEKAIQVGSVGLVKKTPGCGCEGIQKAMNEKRFFVARNWWRSVLETLRLRKKVVPPWENDKFSNREFFVKSKEIAKE
jgi:hypothetical protein